MTGGLAHVDYVTGSAGYSDVDAFAFDKSVRSYDSDGHLRISDSPLSKAVINGYMGWEIPEYQALGLEADRLYQLFRDPDELAKGARTFEGKPVMIIHRGVTANDHARSLVVGAVGQPVSWDGTYVRAPLTIWDGEAIEGIRDGSRRQLSSSYRYRADMTPGNYQGTAFDGVMRNIEGNHVALVDAGRAGPDVMVGDSALSPAWLTFHSKGKSRMAKPAPTRTALLASGALRAYLIGKMAADSRIDLAPILKGIGPKTWATDKALIIERVTVATKGKLAEDADLSDLPDVMGTVDQPALEEAKEPLAPLPPGATSQPNAGAPAGVTQPNPKPAATDDTATMKARVQELLQGKLTPEDLAAVLSALDTPVAHAATDESVGAAGGEETNVGGPGTPTPLTKAAMDAAIATARKETQAATIKQMRDIAEAHRLVTPLTGQLAMDAENASQVYAEGLKQLEVALDGVPESAYKALFTATWGAVSKAREASAELEQSSSYLSGGGMGVVPAAYDSAADEDIRKRFPNFSSRQV